MEYELLVAPLSVEPSLVHWYVKGPVPEATVLNEACAPGQLVSEVKLEAEVLVSTVSEAQLVTLLQLPVTCTQ